MAGLLMPLGGDGSFWQRARRHLVRYGNEFLPVVVERAQGSWLHTTDGRKILELASGYLSLRLVQADHERQIAAAREGYRCLQVEHADRAKQMAALQADFAAENPLDAST